MELDLIIKNGKIYSNKSLFEGSVLVKDGKIVSLVEGDMDLDLKAKKVIDAKGLHVLPGSIDPHVHIRDPGRSDRETFETGTKAAAAGGVTTILEHPISSPPQYSPEILKNRIDVAKPQAVVDYAFFGAAGAEFPDEIHRMAKEDIVAFKTFLHEAPEGRDAEFKGLTMANDAEVFKGFTELAKTGIPCTVHAENNDMIASNIAELRKKGRTDNIAHCESRPPVTEFETVEKLLLFSKETGATVAFAHISTPEAMEAVKKAKQGGLEVYLETCPHFLFHSEESVVKFGAYAKCNPPLRDKKRMEALWDYVNDGSVDYIGSDHAAFLKSEKEMGKDDIFKSPSGFPGLEVRVPLMLNAVSEGKIKLDRAMDLLSENVAKIFKVFPQKGIIQIGSDADFMLVDMEKEREFKTEDSYCKSKDIGILYDGWKLKGFPVYTIVRGRVIMENGIVDETSVGYGQLIKPNRQEV